MSAARAELDRLVNRSRRLGAFPELVVHGGGNTSSKLDEVDFAGRRRRVLRVKGSGTDLASIDADGFPGLFLDELRPLRARGTMSDEEMVGYLAHCMVEPGSRAPSIETLLHAFLPATHVDHVHADTICALTNHPGGRQAVASALGDEVAYVPYLRPGFDLSARVAELADARAVVLEHHGLVTWAETHEDSVDLTWELVDRAAAALGGASAQADVSRAPDLPELELRQLLLVLRAELAHRGLGPCVLHVDRRQRGLADRPDAERIAREGRATPDHILRIGAHGLLVEGAGEVPGALDAFAAAHDEVLARHRHRLPDGQAAHPPVPRVALVPGLGCIAAGATPRAARINADLALRSHTVAAMTIDAFGELEWLDEQEAFDFDYWPLELRKLALAPAPPPLTGRIVAVPPSLDGLADDLRRRGAVVTAEVHRAVLDHGGLDGVVVERWAPEAAVQAARAAWAELGAQGTVVAVGADAGPEQEDVVLVAGPPGGERDRAVAFALASRPGGLDGSCLIIREEER